ncbi:MAG: hypothetical protein KKE12_19970 [Proteobacteria bacterium]|nr:hypothetical protein [Pseudomonadota bacterium]
MLNFLLKKLLAIIPVLLGITLLLFFMLRMLPGDPAQVLGRPDGLACGCGNNQGPDGTGYA